MRSELYYRISMEYVMVDWTFQVEVIEKSCRKDRPMTAGENTE